MTLQLKSTPLQKFIILALAIVLVFAISLPVAAADYFTTTEASYIQDTAPTYSTAINVTLEIQSRTIDGEYIQKTIPITLTPGATPRSFYVLDALLAAQSNPANDITFKDTGGNTLDASDTYFFSIVDEVSEIAYGPTTPSAWDGWVFRINGQFPQESAGWGASIATAYLKNGDVITTHHDDVNGPAVNADFAKIRSVNLSGSNLTVNVRASDEYFGPAPGYIWYLSDFTNYQGATVKVYAANGTTQLGTGTTGADGNATIALSGTSTSYVVEVARDTYDNGLIKTTRDRVVFVP